VALARASTVLEMDDLNNSPQVRDLEADDLAENRVVVWLELLASIEAQVSRASALRVSAIFARMIRDHLTQRMRIHH